MKVPHCKVCEHHMQQPNGMAGNYHKCSLKAQPLKEHGLYHDGLMYASEAKTSPFLCPIREAAKTAAGTLVFETKNDSAYVKVFSFPGGYAIESYMKNRKPQTIRSTYQNSKYSSERTEWNEKLVTLHGYYEKAGFIDPVVAKVVKTT